MSRVPQPELTEQGTLLLHRPPLPVYEPWPFQAEDVAATIERLRSTGGAACWHEMGLGKTLIALWVAKAIGAEKILVITTKTGKVPFEQHGEAILPHHRIARVDSTHTLPYTALGSRCIVLAHYQLFQTRYAVPSLLAGMNFDFVIVDEAHRIKNRNAGWTKCIKRVTRNVSHKLVMTGTPFVNAPDEMWSLLNFLYPKEYTSYWRFRREWVAETVDTNYATGATYRTITGFKEPAASTEAAFRALMNTVGVRRRKRDVKPEMPPVAETVIPVTLSAAQQRMYDEMRASLLMLDQAGLPITAPAVIAQIMRMRQVTAGTPYVKGERWDADAERIITDIGITNPSTKLDAVVEILEGTSTPSVVFSNFKDPLTLLEQRLTKAGISNIHMQASDTSEERFGMVQRFQSGGASVFLSTIALGGESIDLFRADKVVFIDRAWSPAVNEQAIGRVDRSGQTSSVQVIDIEAKGTIDLYVAGVLQRKQAWFDAVFNHNRKEEP